jgi:hypothetical protein
MVGVQVRQRVRARHPTLRRLDNQRAVPVAELAQPPDEPHLTAWLERRAALKYFLRPGGIWNMLTHWRRLRPWVRDRRGATPGDNALIAFVPETAEFVHRPPDAYRAPPP